jgi:hypothetical protein
MSFWGINDLADVSGEQTGWVTAAGCIRKTAAAVRCCVQKHSATGRQSG